MKSYTFIDMFRMDVNSSTIIPIIIFAAAIVTIIFQIVNIFARKKWILLPITILMTVYVFTKPLETILLSAIATNTMHFIFARSDVKK